MRSKDLTGPWGEALAAEYLRKSGETVIACNYRTRFGEIDLISQNRKYVIFTEVKLRKSDAFAEAREFVDRRKQDRLRTTAELWLSEHETQLQPRFDIIEIYAQEGIQTKNPVIRRIEDAFE